MFTFDTVRYGLTVKKKFHIITRNTDVNYIKLLDNCYQSIINQDIDYEWFIISTNNIDVSKYKNTKLLKFDKKPDWANLINHYLDNYNIRDSWIYVLDNDNLLHPNFNKLNNIISGTDDVVIFSQQLGPTQTRVVNDHWPHIENIDNAQCCIKRSIIGDLRYWNTYRTDGYFITELKIKCREKINGSTEKTPYNFKIHHEVLSYYNAQKWLL